MRIKSIQTKFMILIIAGIVCSTFLIGGIGIYTLIKATRRDSVNIMNLTCGEKVQELNMVFERIEKSVGILAKYSIDKIDDKMIAGNNQEYIKNYTETIEELGYTIVTETEGAVAVYVRLNPEKFSGKAGFFTVYNKETGRYEAVEPTDLTLYDETDIEHVGWYYIPVRAEDAVWMMPYHNKNLDIKMVSYVMPIYKDNELIGVAGIDIEFNYIANIVNEIKVYETGHAFLADTDFNIVYSRHYREGKPIKEINAQISQSRKEYILNENTYYEYVHNEDVMKVVIKPLKNEMYLSVTVPVLEIEKDTNQMIMQILMLSVIIAIVFVCITTAITRNIVKPLKDLNATAKEIANGNLDIMLTYKSEDEVGTLAKSVQETARQLKLHMEYINNLAYTDKLTSIQNNTAYLDTVAMINKQIADEKLSFAVFVIDINGLKYVNDNFGHNNGNKLIIVVSEIILKVFKYENVYRVGGDEFTVIMLDIDEKQCEELEKMFCNAIEQFSGELKVYAAIGGAVFQKTDTRYEDVFKRADEKMYKNKELMKKTGKNSSIK